MAIRNIILMEAVENANQPTAIAALIKKQMSTCKLTAFTSDDACQNFYLSFFFNLFLIIRIFLFRTGRIYTPSCFPTKRS